MKKPNFAAMNPAVAEAIKQMMAEQGDKFSLEKINLADLGRRTGISRAKLRRIRKGRFSFKLTAPYSEERRKAAGELAKKENLRRNGK